MASDDPPAAKRARRDEDDAALVTGDGDDKKPSSTLLDPISPDVLARSEELAKSYAAATPFPHGLIRDFCKDGFLEEILAELKNNSKVKFKETDLFRVYQSVDLGNLEDGSDLASKMPALMKLKGAMYSPEYRAFVERIAGLEPDTLTEQVDCAANCHAKGCHLLCHDDVIGTRKVSYIVYLTDPAPEWKDEDGGRLELYEAVTEGGSAGKESRRVPGPLPVKTVLPAFNSMAYFVVQPGVSFHSVQEVFCDRPRLSIQGWYHSKEAPALIENATLQRLKSTEKGEDTEGGFEPMDELAAGFNDAETPLGEIASAENDCFDHQDRAFLGKYINAAYLTDESMKEMCTRFEEESSVKLRHFLLDEWNSRISRALAREDERDGLGKDKPALDYGVGANEKMQVVGPAHKQRYLQRTSEVKPETNCDDPSLDTGDYLSHLRHVLFRSAAFGRWLGRVSSLGYPLGQRGRVRRFRPGLDYTVAHYGVLTRDAVLDTSLCFCAGEGKQCAFDEETNELIGSDDDALWESGDSGGFECYIAADEDGEEHGPDAEYDEEDDTRLLSVSASNNTLSLVYRDPGTMRFVKYVGASAPSSRWDIALEYDVKTDEDEAEAEDEDEAEAEDGDLDRSASEKSEERDG